MELNIADNKAAPKIEGVLYGENYFPFAEIPTLRKIIEARYEEIKINSLMHPFKKGDYLYRAVDKNEWLQIQKDMQRDKAFLIRPRTKFKTNKNPLIGIFILKNGSQQSCGALDPFFLNQNQTEVYADEMNIGKVIRVKIEGPFFRYAVQVQEIESIESFLPHYANHVEVFNNKTDRFEDVRFYHPSRILKVVK